MAEKKTRKELLKHDDAFIAAAGQSALWLKHHRKIVVGGVLTLFVVVAAVWLGIDFAESRRLEASRLYGEALAIMEAPITSDANPTGSPPTFATEQERAGKAREAFARVVDEASSTGVADLARVYIADIDAKDGNTDEALAAFRELADELSPDDNLFFLAVERSAYLLEQKGDVAGAIAMWERLSGSTERFYADRALYQIARLHAQKGDVDQAREVLGRFEKEFPTSSVRPEVDRLFAQVGRPEATAQGTEGTQESK